MAIRNIFGAGILGGIMGTDRRDVLFGTRGADEIDAGAGNDVVFGRGGDDAIRVGAGDDVAFGMGGDDTFAGGGGDNRYFGGAGFDVVTYEGTLEDYDFDLRFRGFTTVTRDGDAAEGEGWDRLFGVEALRFGDGVEVFLDGRNNGPVARGDVAATSEETPLALTAADLLANDIDVDGDTLTLASVATASAGGATVTFDGTTIIYDASVAFDGLGAGETAQDTFTYTVDDGKGGTDTGTVTVTVTGEDDAAPPVFTINEVDSDTAGTDTAEFLELYDGGVGGASLDGLALVFFNGSNDASYRTIDLAGRATNADGFFVVGNEGVPGVDIVIPSNGIQNGADGIALLRADADAFPNGTAVTAVDAAAIVDAVVYGTNDADDAGLLAALGQSVQFDEGANGDKDGQSIARVPDGDGGFATQAPTPGASNGDGGGGGGDAEPVAISAVQGAGDASPLDGQRVSVTAVVVGDFQDGDGDDLRNLGGFFLQEEAADQDSDAATSEGVFVFDGDLGVDVSVGDRVTVTGTVAERFGQTQIAADAVTVDEAGAVADVSTLAQAVTLDDVDDVVEAGGDFLPDLERYEGMLVAFTDTLTVNETFQLDRFNEVRLTTGERPTQYTQENEPDAAGFEVYQREIGSDQVVFDDGLGVQNAPIFPEADLNGDGVFDTSDGFGQGDTIDGLTGVLTFAFDEWRVRSVDDSNAFQDAQTREETPPDVGDATIKVSSFNVLNFFTTLDVDGNPGSGPNGLGPRGADGPEEFDRQLEKLITALRGLDADVHGLVELENEFGFDQNGDEQIAIQAVVDGLNAFEDGDVWAAVDPGRGFVDTGDAISVGMIYKTTSVALLPDSVAILDDSVLPTLDVDPRGAVFDGPSTNRAPLLADFEDLASGETFSVAVTHMKSKGGNGDGLDADQGDGAGNFDELRTEGVEALTAWLDREADDKVLVLGDFNAYAREDPIDAMKAAGYTNLEEVFDPGATTFVFDGQTGTLDYAFANEGIRGDVTGAGAWQINSNEPDVYDYNTDFGRDAMIFDGDVPYRASDHDPLLVGLSFDAPDLLV